MTEIGSGMMCTPDSENSVKPAMGVKEISMWQLLDHLTKNQVGCKDFATLMVNCFIINSWGSLRNTDL